MAELGSNNAKIFVILVVPWKIASNCGEMLILEKENIPLSCTKESNQNNQNPLLFDVYLNFVSRDSFWQEGCRSRGNLHEKVVVLRTQGKS